MRPPIEHQRSDTALPRTEWFVKLADATAGIRLPAEVAVVSSLSELTPQEGDRVLASVSVGFSDRPILLERPSPDGVRVISGLDPDAIAGSDLLATYLDRAITGRTAATTLTVGVVGYGPFGGMGYSHGLACTETPGLEFGAAADLFGITGGAERPPSRRVVRALPVHHASIATQLLEAGIHAVIEKPMCLTTEDADDLIARAADRDLLVTVHQSRRWDRDYLALRSLIRSGEIGDVFNIETFVGGFGHPCRAWHSEESISGGAIYDWGSHHVDGIIQLYGSSPQAVRCIGHKRVWHDTTNLDQLTLHMSWSDGREATFRQSDIAAIRRPKFYVQGEAGTAEGHYRPMVNERLIPGRGFVREESHHAEAPVDLTVKRFDGTESRVAPEPHPGWGFHVNLANHLLLGEPLAVTPASSRDVVRVLEAGHRSAQEAGSVIRLD